jgi:pyruvate kinase
LRRTNIIATLGPASDSEAAIGELLAAGVDVFRLNFSHGTHASHRQVIERIRVVADREGRSVALLQDLGGPKIRTGTLAGGKPLPLATGDRIVIAVADEPGGPGRITTTYADLPAALRAGDALLLDDGHIQLKVIAVAGKEIQAEVVDGGALGEHKGINVPGVPLPTKALTGKDLDDIRFGVAAGVDWMALSFVRDADDLRQARRALAEAGAPALPLVAKLERPEALDHLDDVLAEADAVMIARGDLGLEVPLERVPRIQKEVTRKARALGVPVIVATQVLESMRYEPRPTRAEVSDAANAVDDGVDAIMLAGETAAGTFPVKAVQTLDLIIRDAELLPASLVVPLAGDRVLGGHGRAICEAAVTLADRGEVGAIVAVTRGGKTARLLSALRPRAPIFAATDNAEMSRRLAMAWGVVPVLTDLHGDVTAAAGRIGSTLVERGVLPSGSSIVLVSITPDLGPGPSNFLKLQRV